MYGRCVGAYRGGCVAGAVILPPLLLLLLPSLLSALSPVGWTWLLFLLSLLVVCFLFCHTHTHMSVQGPTSAHSPRADYIYRIFLLFRGWLTGWLADCAGLVWAAALPLPLQQPLCGVDTSALFSCCHGFMINLNLNLKSYIETLTSSSVAVAIGATRTRHPPSPSPLLSSAWS